MSAPSKDTPMLGNYRQSQLAASRQETPDYLIPKMRDEPVSPPVYYKQLIIQHEATSNADKSTAEEITEPVDFFSTPDDGQLPGKPLIGALLTYEQVWYEDGLTLGQLLHSTCLAPGEVTKVAITHFNRSTSGRANQATSQDDSKDASTAGSSGVREVQSATSSDVQSGKSFQASASAQVSGSYSESTLFQSGSVQASASASMGASYSSSRSETDMAAHGARDVQQTTVSHSHAYRGRQAMQIQEVSENEEQSASTRVIANYNHMHSLSMLYFEVLQVYEVTTKVVNADRVIFIPAKPLELNKEFLTTNRDLVASVMTLSGYGDFSSRLNDLIEHYGAMHLSPEQRRKEIRSELNSEIAKQGIAAPKGEDLATTSYEWLDAIIKSSFGERHDYTVDAIINFLESNPEKITIKFYSNKKDGVSHPNPARGQEFTNVVETILHHYGNIPEFELAGPGFSANREDLEQIRKFYYIRSNLRRFRNIQFEHFHNSGIEQTENLITKERDTILLKYLSILNQSHFLKHFSRLLHNGEPLVQLVDPRPIALHGHYIAFKYRHLKSGEDTAFSLKYTKHFETPDNIPKTKIVIPSGGVFGEAVLGQGVAAEKIDLTRFWNWQDSPIPILPSQITPVGMESRARGVELQRAELDASSAETAQLQEVPSLNLNGMISQMNANVRDMSGRAELATAISAHILATQSGSIASGEQTEKALESSQRFATDVLNSDVVKTASIGLFPEAKGATVLGGLMGAQGGTAMPAAGGEKDSRPADGLVEGNNKVGPTGKDEPTADTSPPHQSVNKAEQDSLPSTSESSAIGAAKREQNAASSAPRRAARKKSDFN